MKGISVLFVGCGDLGCRSGAQLLDAGWQVAGIRRDLSRLPEGFEAIAGDYTRANGLDVIAAVQPDYIVTTFNPSERSVEGYQRGFAGGARNLLEGLGGHQPKRILCVSSTRVYAECDGGWVDETSALAQDDPRARALIAAEQTLLDSPLPVSVIRFAGIYGSGTGRLLERVRRGELCASQPPRFSNRIHRDDCAGFLCHLLDTARSGVALAPVYNGVDDLPAPQYEVEAWLAATMGLAPAAPMPPCEGWGETKEASNIKHKRCSNRLLHASGYCLKFPDYRAGYSAVLSSRQ